MWVIRREQMRALDNAVLERKLPEFTARVAAQLGADVGAHAAGDLSGVVRSAVLDAWDLGFDTEAALVTLAGAACLIDGFMHQPSVRTILERKDVSHASRIELLFDGDPSPVAALLERPANT